MTTRVLPRSGSVLDQQTPLLPGWDAADLNRAGRIPKILLVGRDLDCLRWMEGALVETGLGLVTQATEVASAVMALRHGAYDLVVTAADLCGPDGGLALIHWIRLKGPVCHRRIPAVVMTARSDQAWTTRAMDNGVTLALRYPLILRDFQLRMTRLIEVGQLAASAGCGD